MVEHVVQIKELVSAVLEDERQLTEAAGAHLQSLLLAKAIRTAAPHHYSPSAELGHFSIPLPMYRLTACHQP